MSRMNRLALLAILKEQIDREIVVSTYSTATDWSSLSERPLNYYSVGAMGLASSHGLGPADEFELTRDDWQSGAAEFSALRFQE